MKTGKLDSRLDTDTMSPTAQQRMAQMPMARMQTVQNRTEKHFLADQAADARTAMMHTLQEMKRTLAQAADVRTCARQHPWIATGSAAVAGFVVGAVVSHPRSTSGERSQAGTDADAPPVSAGREPARAKTGFLRATLGTALTGIVQTLLQSVITVAVVATEVDQSNEESQTPYGSTPFDSSRGGRPEDVTL